MGKRTHIVGNSALGQRISLIPNSIIDNIVEQYKGIDISCDLLR
jgi:hypothetical protein